MKKSIFAVLALLLAILMAACSGAENAQNETETEDDQQAGSVFDQESEYLKRPLTASDIDHYLKAVEGFTEKGKQMSKEDGALQSLLQTATLDADVKEIVQKAGFANVEEFGMVSAKISHALMAIQMENSGDNLSSAKQEMLKAFDEQMQNPDLDEATKQMIRQQKDAALATISQMSQGMEQFTGGITPAEVELVRGFLDRLEKVYGKQ